MTRIAVDIDEVLCPFFRPMIKRAGYKVPKHPHPYVYRKALHISEEESSSMVKEFYKSKKIKQLKPLKHSHFGVYNLLGKGYTLYAVTGRQNIARDITEEWLCDYFPHAFTDLIFTNSFTKDEILKVDICKALNLSYIIDDNFTICEQCNKEGIQAIHFVGDPMYPWCYQRHPEIARVSNWLEVLNEFPLVEDPSTS